MSFRHRFNSPTPGASEEQRSVATIARTHRSRPDISPQFRHKKGRPEFRTA
jgi:hypothetical protein